MGISFNSVPSAIRVPFLYAEFDSSRAVSGPSQQAFKILVMGQRLASGTVNELIPTRVTSKDQAKTFFGAGSMLHLMLEALLENNSFTELWAIALDDDAAGVKATGAVTFAGTATKAGTHALYIAGKKVSVAAAAGQTAAQTATAVAAAINADANLPVTAAVDGTDTAKVNITFKHKGVSGNHLDIRFNYSSDDAFPAGQTASVTAMSGGTTNPDISGAIAALGDAQYHVIAFPYTDATNLGKLEVELDDRWGPLRQNEGYAIACSNVSLASLSTLGESRNNAHVSIVETVGMPRAPWVEAAAIAGVVAYYAAIDPGRPFQTLEIKGALPPSETDRLTLAERNVLLYDGIATLMVTAGGKVAIERLISTYKKNALGGDDISYLDANTHFTLSYIRYDFRNYFLRKYPRHKLASDGVRIAAGQAIMTPKIAKAEAIACFRNWESLGLVENIDQFKNDLIVERNAQDPNRLDFMLPPDLANQLMIMGVQIGFLL